jgi:hypothetical protein
MKLTVTKIAMLCGALVVLGACKTTTSGTGAGETGQNGEKAPMGASEVAIVSVSQRAEDRWNHVINKRFDEAYDMFTPGYRQSMPREDWVNTIKNRPLRWTEAKAIDQACSNPLSCKVKIKIKFSLTMPGAGDINSEDQIYEDWLQVNGAWYYLPKTVQAQ